MSWPPHIALAAGILLFAGLASAACEYPGVPAVAGAPATSVLKTRPFPSAERPVQPLEKAPTAESSEGKLSSPADLPQAQVSGAPPQASGAPPQASGAPPQAAAPSTPAPGGPSSAPAKPPSQNEAETRPAAPSLLAATPAPPPVPPVTAAAAPSEARLEISLKDFVLAPDKVTARAGKVVFVLSNLGRFTHDFRLEGNGVDDRSPKVGAGRTFSWEIPLKAGEYKMSCPISNHADRGMTGVLKIVD